MSSLLRHGFFGAVFKKNAGTRVGVASAILRNLSRDLGLGIAVMTIVRSFSESHLARILVSFLTSGESSFGDLYIEGHVLARRS